MDTPHTSLQTRSRGPSPSFPRRRAVHRDESDEEQRFSALQAHTLAQRDRRLVNPQGGADKKTTPIPARHTGFKAVSTGRGNSNGHATHVIADLTRNPEGRRMTRVNKSKPTKSPSPLIETFSKPIQAVQSNSPLSNYRPCNGERLRHDANSFPRSQPVIPA